MKDTLVVQMCRYMPILSYVHWVYIVYILYLLTNFVNKIRVVMPTHTHVVTCRVMSWALFFLFDRKGIFHIACCGNGVISMHGRWNYLTTALICHDRLHYFLAEPNDHKWFCLPLFFPGLPSTWGIDCAIWIVIIACVYLTVIYGCID